MISPFLACRVLPGKISFGHFVRFVKTFFQLFSNFFCQTEKSLIFQCFFCEKKFVAGGVLGGI